MKPEKLLLFLIFRKFADEKMIVQCKHTTALLIQLQERCKRFFSRVFRMFGTLIMPIWYSMHRINLIIFGILYLWNGIMFPCFIHSLIHSFIFVLFLFFSSFFLRFAMRNFECDRHWANSSCDTFAFNEFISFSVEQSVQQVLSLFYLCFGLSSYWWLTEVRNIYVGTNEICCDQHICQCIIAFICYCI